MNDDAPFDDERPGALRRSVALLGRWRAPLVLLPLVAGLVVAGGIGASMLWADAPERADRPADVTCWDGAVRQPTECTLPTGVEGLSWVFPRLRAGSERCTVVERRARALERPTEVACRSSVNGLDVTVTYSQRTTLKRGLAFLRSTYPRIEPVEEADGERLVWRDARRTSEGTYRLTAAYAQYPYAVTVEAPSISLRNRVLADMVAFRPADDLAVRPAPAQES